MLARPILSPAMQAIADAVARMPPWPTFEASGAPAAPRPAYHATRDMPRCQWYGQHRYDGKIPNEHCMDCGCARALSPIKTEG